MVIISIIASMKINAPANQKYLFLLCLQLSLLMTFACGKKKECPGFSDNLLPYIPQEDKLVFRNELGDSLVFSINNYEKTPSRTLKQNIWATGGPEMGKPYCISSCGLRSEVVSSDARQLGYTITVDNEALSCSLSISISSSLPSNDYFLEVKPFTSARKLFGDTLRLGNAVPTTDPRFSLVEVVYGRGIVKLKDDVENCIWVR
jgi:hypothetical protein